MTKAKNAKKPDVADKRPIPVSVRISMSFSFAPGDEKARQKLMAIVKRIGDALPWDDEESLGLYEMFDSTTAELSETGPTGDDYLVQTKEFKF